MRKTTNKHAQTPRSLDGLVEFAGCMCANCGNVLPYRVSGQNPLKQLQPIDGAKEREAGQWLEVMTCTRCKFNSLLDRNVRPNTD